MIAEAARFVRFSVVGVANTLLTLVTFALLTRAGVAASPASALAFAVGATNGYVLNRSWTFRAPSSAGTLARYVVVQAIGAGCSAAGVAVAGTAVHRLTAECVVIPVVTVITYTLSRRLVFQSSPATAGRPRASAVTNSVP